METISTVAKRRLQHVHRVRHTSSNFNRSFTLTGKEHLRVCPRKYVCIIFWFRENLTQVYFISDSVRKMQTIRTGTAGGWRQCWVSSMWYNQIAALRVEINVSFCVRLKKFAIQELVEYCVNVVAVYRKTWTWKVQNFEVGRYLCSKLVYIFLFSFWNCFFWVYFPDPSYFRQGLQRMLTAVETTFRRVSYLSQIRLTHVGFLERHRNFLVSVTHSGRGMSCFYFRSVLQ
jgi:hypothetical protein